MLSTVNILLKKNNEKQKIIITNKNMAIILKYKQYDFGSGLNKALCKEERFISFVQYNRV